MDEEEQGNIFTLVNGGKTTPTEEDDSLPQQSYVLVTHQGEEYYATGFLIFTSHHAAIMRDTGKGAIPVMVVPLTNLKIAELVEEDEVPF